MSISQPDRSPHSLVEEFLSHPSRFAAWSDDTRRRLAGEGRVVHVARQTVLATAGSAPEACYMIMDGIAAAATPTLDGAVHLVGFLYPGAFLGLAGMISDQGTLQNWYAQSPMTALRIPRRTFVECCFADQKMMVFMLESLSAWGRGAATFMAQMIHSDARGRVAFALLRIFEQHPMSGERYSGRLYLSQADLCQMTGLTRQSISSQLRTLRELGVLEPESTRIVVKSVARLQELVAGRHGHVLKARR